MSCPVRGGRLGGLMLLVTLVLGVAGCASGSGSGVAGWRLTDAGREASWSSLRRVVVRDFEDRVSAGYAGAPLDRAFDKRREMERARVEFADLLAEKLRQTGAFETVTRNGEAGPGVLVIGGALTRWDEGDGVVRRATRARAGTAQVEARVELREGGSGTLLASMLPSNGPGGLQPSAQGMAGMELGVRSVAETAAETVARQVTGVPR